MKNNRIKKTAKNLLALLLLTFSFVANAQLYPVQITTNFVPPHNVTLSSYTTTTTNKINLRLNLTDINENNLQIRLKMKITGRGLNIQSRDFIIGALPIFINGGQILDLTSYDLRPYFELQNLAGINPQQYNRPLPDGFYKICFEVYTANTPIPQLISNPNIGCTFVNIIINDPPELDLPQRGEQIVYNPQMGINFQWRSRHTIAGAVQYEFELRELWDTQIDPQAGFLASPPLFQTTTPTTMYNYNIANTALLPDKTYAWRVKAISTDGFNENSVFKNNGYSEIYYFKITQNCDAPIYAMSEALSTGRVKITWQGKPEHNKYHVQYKKTDVEDAEWFEVFTYNNQAQISNLEAGVTYDFRVGGTCNSLAQFEQSYTYTNVNQFTMPTEEETVNYNCGVLPDIQIDNQDPLQNLGVNETFTAGDFPVTVKEVEGGNGRFSGKGFIVVPYLADTKIAVAFEGITINTKYQLIDGVVKTTYNPTWGDVASIDGLFGDGAGGSKDIAVDFTITLPDGIQIDPNGDILIVSPDGGVIEVTGGKDVIITDGSSPPKQFAIDEDGNITELGEVAEGGKPTPENTNGVNTDGETTDIKAKGVTVTFSKAEDGNTKTEYGFDAYNSSYSSTKELYTKLGSNYYIPYKAVKNGDSDYLIANINITDNTIVADSLVFKTQDGTAIEVIEKNSDQWTLKVEGFLTDADKEVLATIKQGDKYNVAGAFKLYHLAEKTIDVIAVDATTADISNLETYLNNVYKQSVVKVNLIKTIDFTNELNNIPLEEAGKIQSGESGFLANYTNDQQKINKELKNRSDYDTNAYYLIFTDKQPSSTGEKGIMPVGRQFGYIYSGGSSTASHELGHGAFKLRHPFSDKSYGWNAGATNWLMDYSSGEHLPYVNWQEIHNPKIKLGIFDSDEEGKYETDGHYSTVYLVCLMLGMDSDKAFELAKASEAPDTFIHSETKFEMNDTWANSEHQEATHSLTNGFHGTEELLTALEFIYTGENDIAKLGALLHRFGDTYAHTDLDNLNDWNNRESVDLLHHLEPWAEAINKVVKEEGLIFLKDTELQKKQLKGKTLKNYLNNVYLNHETDKFKMYGEKVIGTNFTTEHLTTHGSKPDFILVRPSWYLSYVNNLAKLIAFKYKLDFEKLDLTIFKRMIEFAKTKGSQTTLKGIIDYEIAKRLNKKYVIVPVFYSNKGVAVFDALGFTGNDYYEIAENIVKNTKGYIKYVDNITNIDVSEIKLEEGGFIATIYGFHTTNAFKIKFK